MTERHHYKYVVLDSSKENGNAVQARFNVQIPHGITNASRVCVKSFSMPNVIHSVYGDLKTVRFVEFYRPTAGGNWVYDIFRFTLPDGYDETADLVNTMQAKFTNNEITRESDGTVTFTHSGQTDTPTTVTITHDTNSYKNTLVFDSGSQHKAIALLVEDQNSHTIWESLGFKKAQILKVSEISGMRDRLNALASGAGADVIANDVLIGGLKFIRGGNTASSVVHRTLESPHAGTHENHNGIYIASSVLGMKVPKLETQRLVQVYYKIRYYKGLLKIQLLDQITGWEVEMEQNTLLSSRLRNPRPLRPLQKRCTPNNQGTSSPLPPDMSSSHRQRTP